jgi:hypothetical protein
MLRRIRDDGQVIRQEQVRAHTGSSATSAGRGRQTRQQAVDGNASTPAEAEAIFTALQSARKQHTMQR